MFIRAPCAHLYSLHLLRLRNRPTPRIWAHIQGRYWSAKIDDISLWPPGPESVATLPPFSPIEGQKWFDQISSQWESQKNRFALIYFGKIQFLPPCIWNLPFMSICPPPLSKTTDWYISWPPPPPRSQRVVVYLGWPIAPSYMSDRQEGKRQRMLGSISRKKEFNQRCSIPLPWNKIKTLE